MVQSARIFLSRAGKAVLGSFFGLGDSTPNAVDGFLVGYDDKGVWFQDDRLQQEGKTLLVKWRFVDTILSDVSTVEEETTHPGIGFVSPTRNRE
jgi:hypothetical protein